MPFSFALLVARLPIPCALSFCSLFPCHVELAEKARAKPSMRQDVLFSGIPLPVIHKETDGSPKFPDYPFRYMTWSQTPVVSWMLTLCGIWFTFPLFIAFRTDAFQRIKAVGFHPDTACRDYPNDHDYTFFGAQYRPYILDPTQLRTSITGFARESHYCPVGYTLGRWDFPVSTCGDRSTHWVMLSNFIPPLTVAEIPTIWI